MKPLLFHVLLKLRSQKICLQNLRIKVLYNICLKLFKDYKKVQ